VIEAALYLSQRSFVNALRRRIQRLRQPKYLVGFLIGLGYFYWILVRPGSTRGPLVASPGLGWVVAALGVGATVLLTWVFGSAETPFAFQLAETDFVFTAPLTRRAVIQFRMLRSQLPLLLSAAFSVLIFSRADLATRVLLRVPALWLLYFTLQLHAASAALLRASLTQQGVTGVRRRLMTLVVLALAAGALWWGTRNALPAVVAALRADAGSALPVVEGVLRHGVLGVVTWPLFAITGPLVATSAREFLVRVPPALLVAAVFYVWVLREGVAFEEAAVEHANKVARRIEAMRRGRAEAPRVRRGGTAPIFQLGARGAPAAALVWKNVTGVLREFRLRTLLLILVIVVAMGIVLGQPGAGGPDLVALLAISLTGVAVLFGPLTLRYDLRRDLELLDVLKAVPLRGYALVGAEVLGPAALISGIAILGWITAFLASLASVSVTLTLGDRLALLAGACLITPPIVGVLFLVQNAAALLFPAWSAIGPERATGFEATGQRIITFLGTSIALVVAVLPAGIVGGIAAIAARALGAGPIAAGLTWAVVAAPVLLAECYLVVRLLGPVLERLEPAGVK
jgi:ABC-2 type transport system permease protein